MSIESVTFRRGRANGAGDGAGDGAAVAAVFGAARAEMTYLPVLHTPDEDREFFTEQVLGSESHVVTVAVEPTRSGVTDDEIVGFSAVHDAWLEHLYVTPMWQGRGIGSTLLRRVMAENPDDLSLWVFEQNRRAVALYARAGFVVVERTDGSGNMEGMPDFRMRWNGISGERNS